MNKLNIRLTNATDCELEFLADRLGLTEAEVVRMAVEKFYESMENDMQNSIMVNESNGQYEINSNAAPEDWREVEKHGHAKRIESLKGWGQYTAAYTLEMPHTMQWYFVAE